MLAGAAVVARWRRAGAAAGAKRMRGVPAAFVPRWHDPVGTPGVRYSLLRPYG